MTTLTRFCGDRLREARMARGITASALAEKIGVTPGSISHYESHKTDPRPRVLTDLARELNLPEAYFLRPTRPMSTEPYLYRSRSAATKRAREGAEVRQRWFMEVFDLVVDAVDVPLPDIDDFGFGANPNEISPDRIEQTATELRSAWGLGEGPVPNMLALVEAKGCASCRFAFGADELSSFSQWSDRPSLALSADHECAVRGRFDAAHELGHLVLHRRVDARSAATPEMHKTMETQAHRFASAFLFPASAFGDEVYSLSLDALVSVKRRWRVSIQTMVVRARDLEIINQDKYERTFREISRRGYRTREPLDEEIPVERPSVLSSAIRLIIDKGVMTRAELLYKLPFTPHDIEVLAQLPKGYLEAERWGEVVALRQARERHEEDENGQRGLLLNFPGQHKD
jgi:Zn-dependent peptidase ImmA (M78 family)/transcriptional regulator with XRE-family HTH domain